MGFLLIAAGMALWIAGGLLAGQSLGEEIPFLGGAAVVALVAAGLVWRLGTAAKAVAAVLGVALMLMLFWVAFSLGAPGAFVEFSGAVMFVVGAFTGIGYSIAAIVRRTDQHAEATRGETRAMRIMLGIVALAMVVSAVLNLTTRSSVDAAAAAGATPATMASFAFVPGEFQATAGETSTFLVHNSDAFTHDFVIESLDVNTGLMTPGSKELVEINAPAGEYLIRCTLHSNSDTEPAAAGQDGDMSALLTVQ